VHTACHTGLRTSRLAATEELRKLIATFLTTGRRDVEHIYKYSKYLAYVDVMSLDEILNIIRPHSHSFTPDDSQRIHIDDITTKKERITMTEGLKGPS
jgi:ligand-binding SRPBCC domain-containing protein